MVTEALNPAGVPTVSTSQAKRLNVNLSTSAYAELQDLSRDSRRSMTEIVRLALALVRVALQEAERGNKLVITDAGGRSLREIVI